MSDDGDECVRIDTRLAGQLKRYHTWPTIRTQTNAEHCWQIMRIYLSVVLEIDVHMMAHMMFHDAGEHFTGDIPFPVKAENPILKEQVDFLEHRAYATQMEYWTSFHQVLLTDADKKLFKDIEIIEMAEFGMDEMCLGNNHGFIIADRCLKKVYGNKPDSRLVKYIKKRVSLFWDQYKNLLAIDHLGDWWFAPRWDDVASVAINIEVPYGSK
jgi:5'-deoxynucleotidase YfbR-like HD superfamily hydrolase